MTVFPEVTSLVNRILNILIFAAPLIGMVKIGFMGIQGMMMTNHKSENFYAETMRQVTIGILFVLMAKVIVNLVIVPIGKYLL